MATVQKRIECRKVIVAPYVIRNDKVQFLIVKDRTFKEWTFITGGCKAYETDYEAALRELYEETKSIVNLTNNGLCSPEQASHFRFVTTYREPHQRSKDESRGEYMVTVYTMFFIDITEYRPAPSEIRFQFRLTKNLKGVYNENLDLTFETIDSFLHKNFVWRFIKQVVVRIPKFRELCKAIEGIRASRPATFLPVAADEFAECSAVVLG